MGLTALVQLWSEWGLRVCVILSLLANLVMAFLSRTRRRSASGWWAVGKLVPASFLWLAYQVAEAAATSAIGNLSLCGLDASEEEKQLVAFWAPFLLLHLGGPDNLTAYAMEDNKLSLRKALEMVLQFLGVGYTIYNYIYRGGHSQALLAASVIMYVVGIVRYGERACALWRANLDNMKPDQDSSGPNDKSSWELTWIQSLYYDGEALLLAQEMFPVWRHAMVDSSVNPLLPSQEARKKMIRTLGWRSMCKVVEMELSLMYEVLYTKANLSYASYWVPCYYLIRLVSPFATAAAVSLFWLDQEQHRGGSRARGSFIGITYALLRVNFLLDITWLLRVLGSTWTYANLQCLDAASGGWYRLHSLVEDPLSWMFGGPIHHRRTWSGTIGRYNLLRECTTTRWCPEWLVALVPDRLKEIRYLSKLPGRVKELLFERVQAILSSAIERTRAVIGRDGEDYTMEDIRTCWGQTALRQMKMSNPNLFDNNDEPPAFGREFEQDVLTWHIATCIFLQRIRRQRIDEALLEAIEVISEYLMFQVAVRRQMLPGLVLHSQLEATRKALERFWDGGKGIARAKESSNRAFSREEERAADDEKLTWILRRLGASSSDSKWKKLLQDDVGAVLVKDAVNLYGALLVGYKRPGQSKLLLELVFKVWVDKLVYAAVNCGRESHAKQLSAGGDLTTVVWMVVQHAGPYQIGRSSWGSRSETKPEEPVVDEPIYWSDSPALEWLRS